MGFFDRLLGQKKAETPPLPAFRKPRQPLDMEVIRVPAEPRAHREIANTPAGADLLRLAKEHDEAERSTPLDLVRLDRLRAAVRCSERASPVLHSLVQHARAMLGGSFDFELYLMGTSDPNASCQWARDRVVITLTDGLLRTLSPHELANVIGHELGHYVSPDQRFIAWLSFALEVYWNQPELHAADEARGDPMAQRIFAKGVPERIMAASRAAELTCDRVGLLCCQDLDAAVQCMIKLAGGASSPLVQVSAEDFLHQADEFLQTGLGSEDEGDTHPVLLLRAKALDIFFRSEIYGTYFPHDNVKHSGAEANRMVEALFSKVTSTEPPSDGDALFLELEALCGLIVAGADGKITPAERRVVGSLPGGRAMLEFWQAFEGRDESTMAHRFGELVALARSNVPRRRLSAMVRRLLRVARADRRLSQDELQAVIGIAQEVGVYDLARKAIQDAIGIDPEKRPAT